MNEVHVDQLRSEREFWIIIGAAAVVFGLILLVMIGYLLAPEWMYYTFYYLGKMLHLI